MHDGFLRKLFARKLARQPSFVQNQAAKIETRKVFYRSNRSGKDSKQLEFTADLPLWPGSNMVTVVARSS